MINNEEAQLSKKSDLFSISSDSIKSISSGPISSDSISSGPNSSDSISSSSNELETISSGSISYSSIKSEYIVNNKNACYEKDIIRRRTLIELATLTMDETDSDSYNYEEYRFPEPSFINKTEIKSEQVLTKEQMNKTPFQK